MDVIIIALILIGITYWLTKPDIKRSVGRPKKSSKPKEFGTGLLQDSNAHDWWNPGSGGI